MRVTVSWDVNIQQQFSGGVLGALANFISIIETGAKQASLGSLDGTRLEVEIFRHYSTSLGEETSFMATFILANRRCRDVRFRFLAPAGYSDPCFILDGADVAPERIFHEVIGRALLV